MTAVGKISVKSMSLIYSPANIISIFAKLFSIPGNDRIVDPAGWLFSRGRSIRILPNPDIFLHSAFIPLPIIMYIPFLYSP